MGDRRHPRDELIAITLELLDHHHPEDLSMREVARRAGLTSGAPSHHFGNKLGLLAASAGVAWQELYVLMEGDEGLDPEEGLQQKARAYIDFALSRPGPYRLIMSRMFDDDGRFAELVDWRLRTMKAVKELITRFFGETGDLKFPYRRGLVFWSLLHGHVMLVLDGAIPGALVGVLSEDTCRMAVRLALLPPHPEDPPTPT